MLKLGEYSGHPSFETDYSQRKFNEQSINAKQTTETSSYYEVKWS